MAKEHSGEKYLGIFDKERVKNVLKTAGIVGVALLGIAAIL